MHWKALTKIFWRPKLRNYLELSLTVVFMSILECHLVSRRLHLIIKEWWILSSPQNYLEDGLSFILMILFSILINSIWTLKDFQEYLTKLQEWIWRLHSRNVTLGLKKLKLLGHIVSGLSLGIDKKKCQKCYFSQYPGIRIKWCLFLDFPVITGNTWKTLQF